MVAKGSQLPGCPAHPELQDAWSLGDPRSNPLGLNGQKKDTLFSAGQWREEGRENGHGQEHLGQDTVGVARVRAHCTHWALWV